MSKTTERCIAYRCPKCGTGVIGPADVIKLPGAEFRLNCTCRNSSLIINKNNAGKLSLSVPCVLCGTPHTFTVQASLLENADVVSLPCPFSGLDICFLGEINSVKAALAESELKLLNTMQEMGIDSFEAFHPEQTGRKTGAAGMELENGVAVMQVLEELVEDGKIRCRCPEGQGKAFDVTSGDGELEIECPVCHAKRRIPLDSGPALQALLEAEELYLETDESE
ncbi:MAG: hypothetical protein IKS35_08065 [Clostridia bacterium]|nr:hypothetical protein [Clostridia bacterium]